MWPLVAHLWPTQRLSNSAHPLSGRPPETLVTCLVCVGDTGSWGCLLLSELNPLLTDPAFPYGTARNPPTTATSTGGGPGDPREAMEGICRRLGVLGLGWGTGQAEVLLPSASGRLSVTWGHGQWIPGAEAPVPARVPRGVQRGRQTGSVESPSPSKRCLSQALPSVPGAPEAMRGPLVGIGVAVWGPSRPRGIGAHAWGCH